MNSAEQIQEIEDTKEDLLDWERSFKVKIKEIVDGNDELANDIMINIEPNLLDKNFLNMVAVVIHKKVRKNSITEEKAKEIFVTIKDEIEKYSELYKKGELVYNNLSPDYEYLEDSGTE